jgi:hypothetical protein
MWLRAATMDNKKGKKSNRKAKDSGFAFLLFLLPKTLMV